MAQGSTSIGLDELVENFSLFGDWEERYRYLIDLGRTLPPMDNVLKTDENLVRGCTARVWLVAKIEDGIFHFEADSDAHRGASRDADGHPQYRHH